RSGRSNDIDLGTVQANETAPITGLDIELFGFGLVHGRERVDQAASIANAAAAASGIGVTRRGEALAGVGRGVTVNIELVGEGRQQFTNKVHRAVVVLFQRMRFHERIETDNIRLKLNDLVAQLLF